MNEASYRRSNDGSGQEVEPSTAGASGAGDLGFIVRTWSVDASKNYQDTPGFTTVELAITHAHGLAYDKGIRTAMVIDPYSTLYAQFNMLWVVKDVISAH